jgi:hypothetical protein
MRASLAGAHSIPAILPRPNERNEREIVLYSFGFSRLNVQSGHVKLASHKRLLQTKKDILPRPTDLRLTVVV